MGGDTFARVKESQVVAFYYNMATLIHELEDTMGPTRLNCPQTFPNYVIASFREMSRSFGEGAPTTSPTVVSAASAPTPSLLKTEEPVASWGAEMLGPPGYGRDGLCMLSPTGLHVPGGPGCLGMGRDVA